MEREKKYQKTLLIDADPQGNATSGVGVQKDLEKSIYNALIEDVPLEEIFVTKNCRH